MDGYLFHLIIFCFFLTSKEIFACNVLPTIPYVDVNKTKGNAFLPGTVLHFKCSANTMPDIDNVTVTTECMRNNTWVIHGAHHCQPEKCYIAVAMFLTATVMAVSSAAAYGLTMFLIGVLNRKSRYMYHEVNGDAVPPCHKPLLKQKI
uniref:Uncharacterized protein LOC111124830 isoform X2 n=1 Tax=Crassostrea virginica TaxID=6565 RepID=A0A8B8D6J1_CRAVI|nr:uncharacterized protein LOC111124830 isoform X2 [Crassostrea virginica]